jgi:aryl-alcohol dehydrogenase-like predicted oxidoreductase
MEWNLTKEITVETTTLVGTDLIISPLCLGTGDMGGKLDQNQSFKILDAFTALGGNFLDTAKIYNDWIPGERSRSEKTIGAWIKTRKNRQNVVLATKGAHFYLETPHLSRVTPADIREDIDASLSHFQTDRIDLYWLHRDDPQRTVPELMQTMEEAVRAGKIRYYGFSNWRYSRLFDALKYAQENHCQGYTAVQNMWSLAKVDTSAILDQTIVTMDDELWNFHNTYQIPAIPFSSQANGLFQKMAAGREPHNPYNTPETTRRFQRVVQFAEQSGLSITQVVLGYLLSQPFPTIPIFSSGKVEQIEDTMKAAGVRLSSDQVDFLLS